MKTQFRARQEYIWLRRHQIPWYQAGWIVARRWYLYRQCEKIRRSRSLTRV